MAVSRVTFAAIRAMVCLSCVYLPLSFNCKYVLWCVCLAYTYLCLTIANTGYGVFVLRILTSVLLLRIRAMVCLSCVYLPLSYYCKCTLISRVRSWFCFYIFIKFSFTSATDAPLLSLIQPVKLQVFSQKFEFTGVATCLAIVKV